MLLEAGNSDVALQLMFRRDEALAAVIKHAEAVASHLPPNDARIDDFSPVRGLATVYAAVARDALAYKATYRTILIDRNNGLMRASSGRRIGNADPVEAERVAEEMFAKIDLAAMAPSTEVPAALLGEGEAVPTPVGPSEATSAARQPSERPANQQSADAKSTPSPPVIPTPCRIVAEAGGLLVSLAGGGRDMGDKTTLAAAGRRPAQAWRFEPTDGPHVRIVSELSGMVLGVRGNSDVRGTDVIQWQWNGEDGQQWRVEAAEGGLVRIASKRSGLYLTAGERPDAPLTQEPNGSRRQLWRLASASVKPGD